MQTCIQNLSPDLRGSSYARSEDEPVDPVLVDRSGTAPPTRHDALAASWHQAPRRWGHPLHRLCSYFAMFPPYVPRVFIEWLTRPGDIVYDPFCGRGTAPMEACRLGRIGLGSDANPLAHVLTAAKVDPPLPEAVQQRLEKLRGTLPRRSQRNIPDEISMLYTPKVLHQLSWLRDNIDTEERADRFILATILGVLHANYQPGSPARGLSVSMPNTFSLAPGYIRRYIAEHQLQPPAVDVFELVSKKIERMALPGHSACRGRAWRADAREAAPLREGPARLVFTSPPYLRVIQYGKYNWIRLWMLRQDPHEVDAQLMTTASLPRYVRFFEDVLRGLRGQLHPDGFLCLMIGDVREKRSKRTVNLAEAVWERVAQPAGWRQLGVIEDRLPQQHKVSRIWGPGRRGRATQVDRILILAPPGSDHTLPAPPRGLDWNIVKTWADAPGPGGES
jgi:DNA modification methylase